MAESVCIELTVELGPLLFEFKTFNDWRDNASRLFRDHRSTGDQCLCIDAKGRVCGWGTHFSKADAEKAFPVKVYLLRGDMREAAHGS